MICTIITDACIWMVYLIIETKDQYSQVHNLSHADYYTQVFDTHERLEEITYFQVIISL